MRFQEMAIDQKVGQIAANVEFPRLQTLNGSPGV